MGAEALRCDQVAPLLPGAVDGGAALAPEVRDHVASCLRCQAELVRYRRLLRALRTLRAEVVHPAPGLVGEVVAALEEAGERHAVRSLLSGRRVAYLVGVGAATAAGAAGAVVLAARSRGGRGRLAG